MRTLICKKDFASVMLALMVAFSTEDALAERTMFTLSEDQAHALSEQAISVQFEKDVIILGIDWKRTSPLVFSKNHLDLYVDFFGSLAKNWDTHLERMRIADMNTDVLGYLPTQDGELSIHLFARLSDGREFADGVPRVRMIYCGGPDRSCIYGQVHFYSQEQIAQLVDLLSSV